MINLSSFKNISKGYTLTEMVIVLSIVGIIMMMLSNILLLSLKIGIKANEISFMREELSTLVNLIQRDVRNANLIDDATITGASASTLCISGSSCQKCIAARACVLSVGNSLVEWSLCRNSSSLYHSICKYEDGATNTFYRTHDNLRITNFQIIQIGQLSTNKDEVSLLITIVADHASAEVDIRGFTRQLLVSTRNFTL